MVAQKRSLDNSESSVSAQRHKKKKISSADQTKATPAVTSLIPEEVDFPRGGGTSFTPLEVKKIRAEAIQEADDQLFEDAKSSSKPTKKKNRGVEEKRKKTKDTDHIEAIRIEHLNYKRIEVGMKILGQIVSIQPLTLIISLPNQLFGHVPITNISPEFTQALEDADASDYEQLEDQEDDPMNAKHEPPDLFELFHEGQFVRAIVTAVHASGSSDSSGISKSRDDVTKSSRRVELSLEPGKVNAGVQRTDLKLGFTLTATVKSLEDHGYILDLGLHDVSGFLSFQEPNSLPEGSKYHVGQVIGVAVSKVSSNGRTCNVTADPLTFSSSALTEVVNATSILPGALVQGLITAIQPSGVNMQILGFFDGTVDQLHMRHKPGEKPLQVGKKFKARVLYGFSAAPPRYALALAEHIVTLSTRQILGSDDALESIETRYPIGTILDAVKVVRLEAERGAVVEVAPGLEGFIHISHVSDDHVPSLSPSSPWKVNSLHRARVTGYFSFDGVLQLSLRPSVLAQKFLQISDIEVGAVVKGTIKKLTPTALFVCLSGNIDGVIWPNHYADIQLKHPAKRFKVGATIKCRVLVVDQERKRISLTAKKTLIESTLAIISNPTQVKPGVITHGTVFRVQEKYLMIEFYNNMKAMVPQKEVSETPVNDLAEAFPIGRIVKVRITTVESEQHRIFASIRQAASNQEPLVDIGAVEIGNVVDGLVNEIHQDNVVLSLQPTGVRALLSLKNLANHRGVSVAQLRSDLKTKDALDNLVVVTRNPEKGIVIVANKPKNKEPLPPKSSSLSIDSVTIGRIVVGRVTRHARNGALVKITNQIGGILHPTDASDDYGAGIAFPAIDSVLKAAVIGIDKAKRQLTLSTRRSHLHSNQEHDIVDPEISTIDQLHEGQTIRGFVKAIADHGLFVTVGRDLDARVQIRELFDDYVKEWKERFKINQLVKGRILVVDKEGKKIEMSFRTTASTLPMSTMSIGNLQTGQKVDGTIKRIEEYGIFIAIGGSKLTGLCHKSQLSDNKDADVDLAMKNFREGDRVKAYILNIEKRKISLSLKPSHFTEDDFDSINDVNQGQEEAPESFGAMEDDDPNEDDSVMGDEPSSSSEEDAMEVDTDQAALTFQQSTTKKSCPTALSSIRITGGFQWSDIKPETLGEGDCNSSSDESDGETQPGKKKKKKEIQHDLTADMQTKTPESNADFERVLLGSPNSSYLWIHYMSFQLQLSEVEKAREIAQRAIKTINFREEQERLNVWIALLNLENIYGTEETLDSAFKEAARANDSKTVHLRLASILAESDKREKAEEQFRRTCKKFSQSSKLWTLFAEFYLKGGDVEQARKLLPRSLQSLEKRKHLKTISRFAQLEYRLGEPERGRTLFEGIVDSHPKRWDLWAIYMDMEAGQHDIQNLRNLFDRVFALKMTSHKAKSFFKKWLQLERRLGEEEGVEAVKQKAIEWTQKANASS